MIWIAGIGAYVPPRVVTNDDIIAHSALKMRGAWIEKVIGIRERRWVDPGTAASDLAAGAIRELGLRDFRGSLFLSTVSPDYLTPSTASVVKRKLEDRSHFPAVDVAAACAGHLFALQLAQHRLAATGEREALVVASEVRSVFLNPSDRRTVFLFGDGACALHVRNDEDAPGSLEWLHTASAPSDTIEIHVPAGGSAHPMSEEAMTRGLQFISMNDGPKILKLTSDWLVNEIQQVLCQHNTSASDFDFFVFHQGNAIIGKTLCEALGVPPAKTHSNFERFGNTSSASLGIALAEAAELRRIKKGDRVLLVAMGAGYHLGIASVVWGL